MPEPGTSGTLELAQYRVPMIQNLEATMAQVELRGQAYPPSDSQVPTSILQRFDSLVRTWRKETGMYSVDTRKVAHPAYLQVIRLGDEAIPLILRELQEHGGRWYQALEAILGYDPIHVSGPITIQELKEKWLEWGRQHEHIGGYSRLYALNATPPA